MAINAGLRTYPCLMLGVRRAGVSSALEKCCLWSPVGKVVRSISYPVFLEVVAVLAGVREGKGDQRNPCKRGPNVGGEPSQKPYNP
jgi:hypothetical protein